MRGKEQKIGGKNEKEEQKEEGVKKDGERRG